MYIGIKRQRAAVWTVHIIYKSWPGGCSRTGMRLVFKTDVRLKSIIVPRVVDGSYLMVYRGRRCFFFDVRETRV